MKFLDDMGPYTSENDSIFQYFSLIFFLVYRQYDLSINSKEQICVYIN